MVNNQRVKCGKKMQPAAEHANGIKNAGKMQLMQGPGRAKRSRWSGTQREQRRRVNVFPQCIAIVNCKYLIIHSPQGFSGMIYNAGWGTLPDCFRCSLQVMKE